jgi:hypothetical protein
MVQMKAGDIPQEEANAAIESAVDRVDSEKVPATVHLSGVRTHASQTVTEAFQQVLASAPHECDLCVDEKVEWLFISATGRSGSTTTLNMLQAIPGIHLAGENEALDSIMDLYNKAMSPAVGVSGEDDGAWSHGERSKKQIKCALQLYVKGLLGSYEKGTKIVGFKEVRFMKEDLIFFSETLFPCARFVVQTRKDVQAQQNSKTYRQWDMDAQVLWQTTKALEDWQKAHDSRSIALHLEDFSVETFNNLLTWAGVSGCQYINVCHANDGGYGDDSASVQIEGKCKIKSWG